MNFHSQAFNHYASVNPYFVADSAYNPYSKRNSYSKQNQLPLYEEFSAPENYIHASEIVILEPHFFSEIPSAVHILRNNQVVVLNLAKMTSVDAQRSVDFIAGGAYMCNGYLEKIDANIFLFTPHSTNIRVEASLENKLDNPESKLTNQGYQEEASRRISHQSLVHQAS